MLISDLDFLAAHQRYQALLQEAERERLIRAAGLRRPANRDWFWNITGAVVAWLWKWGAKPVLYGPTQSAFSAAIYSPITLLKIDRRRPTADRRKTFSLSVACHWLVNTPKE
jgi:hypothetical protein